MLTGKRLCTILEEYHTREMYKPGSPLAVAVDKHLPEVLLPEEREELAKLRSFIHRTTGRIPDHITETPGEIHWEWLSWQLFFPIAHAAIWRWLYVDIRTDSPEALEESLLPFTEEDIRHALDQGLVERADNPDGEELSDEEQVVDDTENTEDNL
jgi:hypothetical protein